MNTPIGDDFIDFENIQIETIDDLEELKDDNYENDDDDINDLLESIKIKQKSVYEESKSHHDTDIRIDRNPDFIVKQLLDACGMMKTAACFKQEWNEIITKGLLTNASFGNVREIINTSADCHDEIVSKTEQLTRVREIAVKIRNQRDHYRMHHNQVIQEKNSLIKKIRRLHNILRSYEPVVNEYKTRYEALIKEKSIIRLERDRYKTRTSALEAQIQSLQQSNSNIDNGNYNEDDTKSRSVPRKGKTFPSLPPDGAVPNPFSTQAIHSPPVISKYKEISNLKAHEISISAVSFHPTKPIFATASDDESWKMWTIGGKELVMAGEGHYSWLSDLTFHPHGSHLATASGDGTLKLWELAQTKCSHTFTDHTQAVWSCDFHVGGDFIVSGSMDHTVRVWDIISGKCRQTLRGHVDSVNAVAWLPYTPNICSASGDKTVSIWDARTGICVQTLYGHTNSCNHVQVSKKGDVAASCDAAGVVKLWDLRTVNELGSICTGAAAVNKLSFDRSGSSVLAACDDGTIKCLNLLDFSIQTILTPASTTAATKATNSKALNSLQCVAYSTDDDMILSGASDGTIQMWS